MAAVTSTIVAIGGLALSAGQMVKANKDGQIADEAAKLAAASIKNTTQENAFEALQAPDVKSLAEQANLQAQANTVNALQDMGPEGAAQVVNAGQAARQGNLQAAQAQAETGLVADQISNFINYKNPTALNSAVSVRIETGFGCFRTATINLVVGVSQIPTTFNNLVYTICDDDLVDADKRNGIAS